MVGGCPLSYHEAQNSHAWESNSKASLEHKGVMDDPNVIQTNGTHNARVEGSDTESDMEFQDSREDLLPGSLAALITVQRSVPTTIATTSSTRLTIPTKHTFHASQNLESTHSVVSSQQDMEDSGDYGAIGASAKFYQDAALEYQSAYENLHLQHEELQSRYTQQACLVEEASGALRVAEAKSSQ